MKRFFPIILSLVCSTLTAQIVPIDLPRGHDTVEVCNRDLPYLWHGKEYNMMGSYLDTVPTANGDSICELVLKINFPPIENTTVEIEAGESYSWRGKIYSQPGFYLDTAEFVGRCGTIYQLVLKNKSTADSLLPCLDNIPKKPVFDYSLSSGNVRCYHGTRDNPFESVSSSYHTYFAANSTAVDPLTKMSVVPAPDIPSFRLGIYAAGHGRGYAADFYFTPTDSCSAIQIFYANAIQVAPSWHVGGWHRVAAKPEYFSVCILDNKGDTISRSLLRKGESAPNFWISYNGPYQRVNETMPWYHPWDSYVVDLKDYVGQKVTINAITTECSTHSCCSELYLAFAPAELKATCCDLCGVVISAPRGKRYTWHKDSPEGEVVSTMDAICVEADSTMYYCDIYDDVIGTKVTLSHIALVERPKAKLNYDLDLCTSEVTFIDSSYVTYDGETPIEPYKHPAICKWDFGNGQTYEGHNPPKQTYEPNHDYVITLVSSNNNVCSDSIAIEIHIPEQPPHYEYTRIDTICATDIIQIGDSAYSKIGEYTDTLQTAIYGCDSIIHTVIRHWPTYDPSMLSDIGAEHLEPQEPTTPPGVIRPGEQWKDPLAPEYVKYDTICQGEQYEWRGHIYTMGGTYGDTLSTIHGCDSIFLLHLYAYPRYIHTPLGPITAEHLSPTQQATPIGIVRPGEQWKDPLAPDYMYHDTICKGDTLLWHGKKLTEEKIYTDTLKTIHGCDSIFYMDLHIEDCGCDTTYSSLDTTIVYGQETFLWFGKQYTMPGIYHDTLYEGNYMGCDSIGALLLRVIYEDSVAVCNEDPYTFITPWGEYTTPEDCDCLTGDIVKTADNESLVWAQLCVTRLQPTDSTTTATICEGESFNWYGHIYTTSKDTSMTLTNAAGCDSICELHLTVLPKTYGDEYQSTCTVPYIWHGKQAADGDTIILRNANGCDSIVTLHLTILASSDSTTTATICEGESFNWYGHIYTASKDTSMTLTNAAGCDSICTLHLTLNAVTRQRYERSICDGTTTTWRGRVLDKAGTYDTILYYVNGCDSILDTLDLKIDELYTDSISTKLCQGESFTWRGNTYSTAGDYVVNAIGQNGDCDSILKLHVDVAQPTRLDDIYYACYNEFPFYRHGHRIELPAEYEWHLTNTAGCDSTIALTVYKSPTPYKVVIDTSFCDGTHLEWRGQEIWSEGIYQDVIHCRNPHFESCDSIYLELHVSKAMRTYCDTTVYVGYCDLPFKWKTNVGYPLEFYKSDQFIENLVNAAGCDSTLVLHVVVSDSVTVVEQDTTLCSGDSFVWHGQTISTHGDYYHAIKFKNIHYQNCDSVQYKLQVKMLYPVSIALFDTICQGDTVMWYEQAYTNTGIYHHTLSYANGCDSVLATLNLTVNEPSSSLTEASMCMGQTYQWNGMSFTNSVDTTIHLTNIAGCDSACRLVLTAAVCCPDTQMVKTYLPGICDTLMPYSWKTWRSNATKISTPGHYEDTLRNKWGCDSIIYTLDIDFYHCCRDLEGEMGLGAICADDDYLSISLDLYSGMMNEYRLHFTNPALNTMPFRDTIVHLSEEDWLTGKIDIDIPIPYDPLDSTHYPRPDIYYVDILVSDSCGNNLHWDHVPFTVLYPSWIIIQRWNDVLALYNERYNGGYTFSEIRWFHEDSLLTARGEHDGYIYIRPTLEYGTPYHAELTRTDDGKTFSTCDVYPHEQRDTIIFKEQVEISHTLIESNTTRIWITTNTSGTYDIYDVSGTRVQHGVFGAEYNMFYIDFEERLPEGVYIIVFRGKDLFDSKKVIYDK